MDKHLQKIQDVTSEQRQKHVHHHQIALCNFLSNGACPLLFAKFKWVRMLIKDIKQTKDVVNNKDVKIKCTRIGPFKKFGMM